MDLKRVVCDIPIELHCKLKAQAALRNIPMQTYIRQAILNLITEDQKYLAPEE